MEIYFEKHTRKELDFDYEKIARDVIHTVLKMHHFPYEASVSLFLVGDKKIRQINLLNRNIDRVTDVLSFPNIPFEKEGDFRLLKDSKELLLYKDPETDTVVLGDIIICQPKMEKQAKTFGHSTLREYAFLVAHSMLHLLGYDHMDDVQRILMEQKQDEVLDILKIYRK